MLTNRMQIQALADRLAGLPIPDVQPSQLSDPWRTCWLALDSSLTEEYNYALLEALRPFPERDQVLQAILSARPGFAPTFPSLQDIAADLPPLEWLWPGWIPRGMLTIFGAAQGSGKSFVALDLAWRIIAGKGFPDGAPVPRPSANVIYVDAEAVPQILNERAANLGLDRSKLYLMMPEGYEMIDFGLPRYCDQLVDMVATLHPELVIIDALSSIHSRGQNNVEDVRELLGFLAQVAASFRVGLLLIHHIRKPGGGQTMLAFDLSMEDLSGSGHITAMARVVLGLHVIQTGPKFDPNGPRELKMLKTNLGPYRDPIGFEFAPLHPQGVFLRWTLDAPDPYRQPTKIDEAAAWLLDALREAGQPMKPKELVEMAEDEGISRRTIYRARDQLGPQIRKAEGNTWILASPQPNP